MFTLVFKSPVTVGLRDKKEHLYSRPTLENIKINPNQHKRIWSFAHFMTKNVLVNSQLNLLEI